MPKVSLIPARHGCLTLRAADFRQDAKTAQTLYRAARHREGDAKLPCRPLDRRGTAFATMPQRAVWRAFGGCLASVRSVATGAFSGCAKFSWRQGISDA